MEEPFFTFRKFNDPVLAAGMAGKLKEHSIPVEIEDSGKLFDPSFANNFSEQEIRVKLRAADFEAADNILRNFYRSQAEKVGADHYLHQFTDLELMDIVRNPDEWGYLDYALAQKILLEHGIAIPSGELKRFQKDEIKLLSRPQPTDRPGTVMAYLLAFGIPPLGILIGSSMAFMKRTLPDGKRLFAYAEKDRKAGRRILNISVLCLLPWIACWLWLRGR